VQKRAERSDLSVNPVVVRKLPEYDIWSEGASRIHATAGVEDAAQFCEEEGESNRDRRNRTRFGPDGTLFDRYDETARE
jgi:hypothetical protein